MRKEYFSATFFMLAALIAAAYPVKGDTIQGAYLDSSGRYCAPSRVVAMRDGSVVPPGAVLFRNLSGVDAHIAPGMVYFNWTGVEGTSVLMLSLRDGGGVDRVFTAGYVEPGDYHADLSGLATEEGVAAAIIGSYSGIDVRLSASHGDGLWNAESAVAVLPFQGSVSYEAACLASDVHVVRGDTVVIPYQAGTDLTGREVWFGAKSNPADETYAIGPVDVTANVTDAEAGTGLISLSTSQTNVTPRRYFAEVELRGQGQVLTPLRFFLWIDPDVVR